MNEMNQVGTEEGGSATPAQAPARAPKSGSGKLWIVLIVLVVLLGVAIGYTQGLFGGDSSEEPTAVNTDPSAVVATVNGAPITRGELDEKIAQVKNTMPAGAVDPTQDATFAQVVLEEMVNVMLLVAKADEKGYNVSDEQVSAEVDTLVSLFGGEEQFNSQLAATGITLDELRDNMRNEMRIRMLVSDETDIDAVQVTDEEVQLAYDTAVGDSPDAASLEEVRELLRTQLIQQKSTAIVDTYIQALRSDADVEINI